MEVLVAVCGDPERVLRSGCARLHQRAINAPIIHFLELVSDRPESGSARLEFGAAFRDPHPTSRGDRSRCLRMAAMQTTCPAPRGLHLEGAPQPEAFGF